MAVITVEDVIGVYPGAEGVPAAVVESLISVVDEADLCLANYPEAQAKIVKILAVAHMLLQQAGGETTSEKSPTGASVTYAGQKGAGQGLASTRFGNQLLGFPAGDCISTILDRPQAFAVSVGGHRDNYGGLQ